MTKHAFRHLIAPWLVGGAALAGLTFPAAAQGAEESEDSGPFAGWDFGAELYLWGSGIGGKAATGHITTNLYRLLGQVRP
ncbi:MAG: hypothetical protein O7H40_04035 [Gammaproteobacteria bacterium]|nr:hypothetical protein [Gammaproteobacteria bacterium]